MLENQTQRADRTLIDDHTIRDQNEVQQESVDPVNLPQQLNFAQENNQNNNFSNRVDQLPATMLHSGIYSSEYTIGSIVQTGRAADIITN